MRERALSVSDCISNANHARAQATGCSDSQLATIWLRLADEWTEVANSIREREGVDKENITLAKNVTRRDIAED